MSGSDIDHILGSDLSIGVGGDLAVANGSAQTRERVIRRLLTNAGGYIWQLDYGGGLAAAVGAPLDLATITATVRNQLGLEAAVARAPAPAVTGAAAADGTVTLNVTYADATTGTIATVAVAPGP